MSAMTFETLMDTALELPVNQRSRLATRLIESIDEDDASLSPKWRAEIQRRIDAARSDTAQRIPHEQVMASVRGQIAKLQALS
jgi:putative addiction module component (TIGR02574 family)